MNGEVDTQKHDKVKRVRLNLFEGDSIKQVFDIPYYFQRETYAQLENAKMTRVRSYQTNSSIQEGYIYHHSAGAVMDAFIQHSRKGNYDGGIIVIGTENQRKEAISSLEKIFKLFNMTLREVQA